METKTQFDLNRAIERWRRGLEKSPVLDRRDLAELESHLRDSVQKLAARGLESREAFLVAVHRLGANPELEAEFAKVNVQQAWIDRGVWILCGLLAANMLWATGSVVSNIALNLALWRGMNGFFVVALAFLTHWLAWGAFIALLFIMLIRFSQPLSWALQTSLKHPLWTGIVLVLALEAYQLLPRHAMRLLEPLWQVITTPGRRVSQENQAIIQYWSLWTGIATQLLWIASVPLFAGYVWRKTSRHRSLNTAKAAGNFGPPEREAIAGLIGRGLSLQEAGLLICARRSPTEDTVETSAQTRWWDRALWMLVGAVVGLLFVPFVLEPSTLLLAVSQHSSSLIQHLAGLGAMCLCLGAIAGVLVAVSKGVTRYQTHVKWLENLCCERPALSAILLAAACLGLGLGLAVVERMLARGQFGISGIGSAWLEYCSMMAQLIVPVVLLLWLVRKRRTAVPAASSR